MRGGRVSRFLCIEKSGEKLTVPAKTWYTSRRIGRERT